jgi:serine protease Do
MMMRRAPLFLLLAFPTVLWLSLSATAARAANPQSIDSESVLRALEDAFVSVADRVTPAVVNVSVKPKRVAPEAESPEQHEQFPEFFGPEFFERFFRRRQPREDTRSMGSGVIVDPRGYILTNNHVVESGDSVEVRLSDDRKFKATIVGRDPKTDLAVVKIEAPAGSLPVAPLGDSDTLRAGQWAIAIGNPFGLDRTVTIGHISATGRTHVGVTTYEAFIQTDASINPGNSGGPLLNIEGKVIGINTAIVSSGQGIGFSIPINMAREIMTQLISKGRVVRGWLGIVIQELTPELAEGFGVKKDSGVLVAEVMKGSPAEKANLKSGDIILEFDGAPIKSVTELQKRVAAVEPGRAAPLVVIRDKVSTPLSVQIGEQPRDDDTAGGPADEPLGLAVEPLTPEAAQRFKLSTGSGVVVTDVTPGSSGAQAGIRPGDAILEINRQPVTDVETFRRIVASVKPGEVVPVYVQRGGGRNEYVVLSIPDKR